VQTFLPYAGFEQSARVLDAKRLGKQRVEVIQVVRALTTPGYGWAHHPAVLMWKGYEEALGRYGITCCEVWTELGFGDTCAATIRTDLAAIGVTVERSQEELRSAGALPSWLGDDELHRSHQSALVRKDPEHYGSLFPGVPEDVSYVWPVRSENVLEIERRKAHNAAVRVQRAAERAQHEAQRARARAEREAEQARRRRSEAAKRAWRNRRARPSPSDPAP